MPPPPEIDRLLRSAACVELDARAAEQIRQACNGHTRWDPVIRSAESHGLAPFLYKRLKQAEAEVPATAMKQLKALFGRHCESSRIRTAALLEIVGACREANIEVLALKGAALAHLIYDEPGLRPMSDIDVLVAPGELERAAAAVAALGYSRAPATGLPDHHHLPVMSRTTDGLRISVEVHRDALARDNIGSIRMDRLSGPLQEVNIDGVSVPTLGHVDMLRHLCRHALEPRESTKLGSALDIMTYAATRAGLLDWELLGSRHPEVVNTLRLLGYLIPWPSALGRHVPAPPPRAPGGVGTGMVPLSSLRRRRHRAAMLFNPSDWWLHAFYNVPPERSLASTKLFRHPARVAFWLWRRRSRFTPD